MSDDNERLERYLEWRERTQRAEREARAARQRWWLRRAGVMAALMIVAGLLTWLVQTHEASRHATRARPGTEPAAAVSASRESAPSGGEAAPAVEAPAPASPGPDVANNAGSAPSRDP